MKLRRSDRSLIAWTLYFCVLLNLFVCGLGHGQMLGQQLNGVGGAFCSVDSNQAPLSDKGLGSPASSDISNYFACPVCAAASVAIVFLIGLAWLLKRYGPKPGGGLANLRVVGALNLGGRERIMVVEVGDQWIVVGAAPGRVNALHTMPRQDVDLGAGTGAGTAQGSIPATRFADWLKNTMDKRNAS